MSGGSSGGNVSGKKLTNMQMIKYMMQGEAGRAVKRVRDSSQNSGMSAGVQQVITSARQPQFTNIRSNFDADQ